jgi:acetoacetyl-CoA synthetase
MLTGCQDKAAMVDVREELPLWVPSDEQIAGSRMTHFMKWAGERRGRTFAGYTELWEWSAGEIEQFWADIWEYCGVRASEPYERVLADRQSQGSPVGPREMPGARWFEGARLNYAENMLLRERERWPTTGFAGLPAWRAPPAADRSDTTAVLHASELRPLRELSWGELSERVGVVAEGLRSLGVERGDRVAAYMPNIPETLIAFLACASIGAIWSCAAPEFGARSVVDRFAQIEPKVLLVVDGYRHGGKDFDRAEAIEMIVEGLPSVDYIVMLPYLFAQDGAPHARQAIETALRTREGHPGPERERADGTERARGALLTWNELSERGAGAAPHFEQVPFDHPLWVLYSSGTTGLPKAIVHSHGGILLEQLKKSLLHLDLRAGDRMFWFTTTGWMMWNFLVGCLFSDAAIVLYDGSPAHPDLGALWALAERTGITCMGVSAGLLMSCEKAGIEPARDHDLSALRSIGSTGSPLAPEGFRWVYKHVGRDIWLFSTSGGTDVCTAFVGGCPLLPVYEGEIQCRALGCAVEAWDEQGRPLTDELGELVLTRPLPSMPLYLWGDTRRAEARDPHDPNGPDDPADRIGERYRESYFDMYPGIWRHGDWIRITPRGGAVIYGRSDSTINRQGVRMGTSEIYRATAAVEEVTDALVVDVPRAGAEELWMILFVVLREGVRLDPELEIRVKRRIREDCSPRHVPNQILQIAEVPRTLSGKVLEVPVKRILMGAVPSEAASVESLANPRSLDYFVELAAQMQRT